MKHICIFLTILFSMFAAALECDCSQRIGTCQATAELQGEILTIRTSVKQCSNVIYELNGTGGTLTVTDGVGVTNFFKLNQGRQYVPTVQSCDVCVTKDQNQPTQAQEPASPPRNPEWVPGFRNTRAELVQKLQAVNQSCDQFPCNVNDAFDGQNIACILQKRSCYADCSFFGKMFKYPADIVQAVCK